MATKGDGWNGGGEYAAPGVVGRTRPVVSVHSRCHNPPSVIVNGFGSARRLRASAVRIWVGLDVEHTSLQEAFVVPMVQELSF